MKLPKKDVESKNYARIVAFGDGTWGVEMIIDGIWQDTIKNLKSQKEAFDLAGKKDLNVYEIKKG